LVCTQYFVVFLTNEAPPFWLASKCVSFIYLENVFGLYPVLCRLPNERGAALLVGVKLCFGYFGPRLIVFHLFWFRFPHLENVLCLYPVLCRLPNERGAALLVGVEGARARLDGRALQRRAQVRERAHHVAHLVREECGGLDPHQVGHAQGAGAVLVCKRAGTERSEHKSNVLSSARSAFVV